MVFVPLKKSFYIILSFLTAFLINELFVKYIIGYPSLGLEKELYGIRSSQGGWQKIYFPYSKYWNVEGGNITEKYNNWGLPGEDIIKDTSKVIFLLGDSFMECLQMKKNDMASSVFQRMLQNDDVRYSVINLSASGHDVYDLYLRKSYYSKIVKPEYIMLVLHSANTNWLLRHHKIDFVLNPDVGKEKKSFIFLLQKCARNSLSSVNLYVQSFKNADPSLMKRTGDLNLEYNENINTPLPDYSLLDKVLLKYSEEYGGRFILLSVTPDKNLNFHLFELHQKTGIKYFQKDISIPQNRINVIGHLTKEGNIKLAQFLYESFETVLKNE